LPSEQHGDGVNHDSDARLFWRAALVAEHHPDAPDCIVACGRLLHEQAADVTTPDISEVPHAR